jgi:hypothetical protein
VPVAHAATLKAHIKCGGRDPDGRRAKISWETTEGLLAALMRRPREGKDEVKAEKCPARAATLGRDRSVFAEFWVHWAETVCSQR